MIFECDIWSLYPWPSLSILGVISLSLPPTTLLMFSLSRARARVLSLFHTHTRARALSRSLSVCL